MGDVSRHAAAPRLTSTTDGVAACLRALPALPALAILWSLGAAAAVAATLTIEDPRADSLSTTATITVRGTVKPDGIVKVRVGDEEPIEVTSAGGKWSVGLPLLDTLNVVSASVGSRQAAVLVTKATNLAPQETKQKVFLDWSDATDDELDQIAVGTLQGLTRQKRDTFVKQTKSQTRVIIESNFSRYGIQFVDTPDNHTHTIRFLPNGDGLTYGQTPQDCLNNKFDGESEVWVGTLRQAMVGSLPQWAPMQQTDTLQKRILDVAHALAHTASHELGHGLGLVTESTPDSCKWMNGCDGQHDCADFDAQHPLAHRFEHGRFLMDPGPDTTPLARIAESSTQHRGTRVKATFTTLDDGYLSTLQPP